VLKLGPNDDFGLKGRRARASTTSCQRAAVTPLIDGRRGVGLTVKIDRINQTIKRARLADLVAAERSRD
jgi:hypothetical protein